MRQREPTDIELRDAREHFAALIDQRAREDKFQSLFSTCPYILSRSLPLRVGPLDTIIPARPGHDDIDFAIYPHSAAASYRMAGVEIKRPGTPIVTVPRMDTMILSRDATTAVGQLKKFAEHHDTIAHRNEQLLFIGSGYHLFAIVGMQSELNTKLDIMKSPRLVHLSSLTPPGIEILPYDLLLDRFSVSIPERLVVLVTRDIQRRIVAAGRPMEIKETWRSFEGRTRGVWSVLEDDQSYDEFLSEHRKNVKWREVRDGLDPRDDRRHVEKK